MPYFTVVESTLTSVRGHLHIGMQGICTTLLFVPLTSPKVLTLENSQIYLEFYSLIRTFETSLEGRLQLRNENKSRFYFAFHSICTTFGFQPKVLSFLRPDGSKRQAEREKTQIIFGFLLTYSYLCSGFERIRCFYIIK